MIPWILLWSYFIRKWQLEAANKTKQQGCANDNLSWVSLNGVGLFSLGSGAELNNSIPSIKGPFFHWCFIIIIIVVVSFSLLHCAALTSQLPIVSSHGWGKTLLLLSSLASTFSPDSSFSKNSPQVLCKQSGVFIFWSSNLKLSTTSRWICEMRLNSEKYGMLVSLVYQTSTMACWKGLLPLSRLHFLL